MLAMRSAWTLVAATAVAALALLGAAGAVPLGTLGSAEQQRRWRGAPPFAKRLPGVELKRPTTEPAAAPPASRAPAVPTASGNVAEEGGLFEGDIILSPDEVEWLKRRSTSGGGMRESRNLVTSRHRLWPGGIVYYDWGSEFSNATQRRIILSALEDIEAHSCIRFHKRTSQKTYLLLRNTRSGCAAPVGYVPIGRPIDLFLGQPGCQRRGTVQHEFLHTLGFWHEHTRPDRDEHVTVKWTNIKPGLEFNFYMRPAKDVQYLKMPYDYDSVMHYRSLAFSKDGRSHTLEPKDSKALLRMGQRERFSKIDLAKINRLYNCPPPYYRGSEVQLKGKKKPSESMSDRISEASPAEEEETTEEEWPGPYPLPNSTEPAAPLSLPSAPGPLPEIPKPPPLPELPTLPPTPSLPLPPTVSTLPAALPETFKLPAPPAPPEPPAPPARISPLLQPEPSKLPTLPIGAAPPAPLPLPEPPVLPPLPSLPEVPKQPAVSEPPVLPAPTTVTLPPSPLPDSSAPTSPPSFPPMVTHFPMPPPPPPLLPLPTLPPVPSLTIEVLPHLTLSPKPQAPSSAILSVAPFITDTSSLAGSAPGPEGPVYVIEEKTAEAARAMARASGHVALGNEDARTAKTSLRFPVSDAPGAVKASRVRREDTTTITEDYESGAKANETTIEEATALVQFLLHLAGISSFKV